MSFFIVIDYVKAASSVFWIMIVVTGLSCRVEDSMRLSSLDGSLGTPKGDECGHIVVCAGWFIPQTHVSVA